MTGSRFVANRAALRGGAACAYDGAAASLEGSAFYANAAGEAGGAIAYVDTSATRRATVTLSS